MRGETVLSRRGDYLTAAASPMRLWLVASFQCDSTLGLWNSKTKDLAPCDAGRTLTRFREQSMGPLGVSRRMLWNGPDSFDSNRCMISMAMSHAAST